MKKTLITLILIITVLCGYSQYKTAKGIVLDMKDKVVIPNTIVKINDTTIDTHTNNKGEFVIDVPKSFRSLIISHNDYMDREIILRPGFHLKPTRIYLQSKNNYEQTIKEKRLRDSIFESSRSTLSVSLLEILSIAIAGRYEYFPLKKHSIGAHLSLFVYGRNTVSLGSEYDYYPVFHGIKVAPAYRFYAGRNQRRLFIEGKIPVGYFYFSRLEYHYSNYLKKSITYSLWSLGYSASAGITFPMRKKGGIITISAGYQFFPIKVPEYIEREINDGTILRYKTDNYWWYFGGPGSKLEIRFLLGGVF